MAHAPNGSFVEADGNCQGREISSGPGGEKAPPSWKKKEDSRREVCGPLGDAPEVSRAALNRGGGGGVKVRAGASVERPRGQPRTGRDRDRDRRGKLKHGHSISHRFVRVDLCLRPAPLTIHARPRPADAHTDAPPRPPTHIRIDLKPARTLPADNALQLHLGPTDDDDEDDGDLPAPGTSPPDAPTRPPRP
ncbi:hypothetical protein BC834DRAFT_967044 [Gloeopeniophorella convolvens]|nr:hypothetical protein BC834DRAFT_967044 [Gloeopeniophorella convolvens]